MGWGGFCLSSELSLRYGKQAVWRGQFCGGSSLTSAPSRQSYLLRSVCTAPWHPRSSVTPVSGAMCVKPRCPFLQVESTAPGHRPWAGLPPEEVPKVQLSAFLKSTCHHGANVYKHSISYLSNSTSKNPSQGNNQGVDRDSCTETLILAFYIV